MQTYIGIAAVVSDRLQKHNEGGSPHTSKFRPWQLVCSISFEDDQRALEFEKNLKTGSGRAFAKRHFW